MEGRTITSFPSLVTDVRNGGGTFPAFSAKAIEEFAKGAHADAPQPAAQA